MGMLSTGEFAMFCVISFIAGMVFSNALERKWYRAFLLVIPIVINLVVFAIRRMWS